MSQAVLARQFIRDAAGQLQVSFTLPSNRPLYGPTKIGELGFTTLPDQPSAFVSLPIVDVTGLKPDGSTAANAFGLSGRVVMLGEAPLLECLLSNGSPLLILYGKPASGYGIDTRTDLVFGDWQTVLSDLTIGTSLYLELATPPSTYPVNFYRAFRAPQP